MATKMNRDHPLRSGLHHGTNVNRCVSTLSPGNEMPMGPNGLTTHHQNCRYSPGQTGLIDGPNMLVCRDRPEAFSQTMLFRKQLWRRERTQKGPQKKTQKGP